MRCHFTPGQTVFVERQVGKHQQRGVTRLLGARPPDHLILEAPVAAGAPMTMGERSRCVVRFLSRGSMIAFWSEVVKAHDEPFPMLIITHPAEFEAVSLRKSGRIGCNLAARVVFPQCEQRPGNGQDSPGAPVPSAPLRATIIDLAKGGCQIAIPAFDPEDSSEEATEALQEVAADAPEDYHPVILEGACTAGAEVALDFQLPASGEGSYEGVAARICWGQTGQSRFFVGLRFVDPGGDMVDRIERLVAFQSEYFTQRFEPVR